MASGRTDHDTAIRINNRYATLWASRMQPGDEVKVPDAPYTHLFVAKGAVNLEGAGALAEGDAVRLTGVGGQRVTASDDAEILIWEMHAAAG